MELARDGKIRLLISEAILGEVERVLRLKLYRTDWEIAAILRGIRNISHFVSPGSKILVIKEDEADNRILECAVEAKAQYVVSGDEHHLLPLGEFEGIKILSPAEFLRLI